MHFRQNKIKGLAIIRLIPCFICGGLVGHLVNVLVNTFHEVIKPGNCLPNIAIINRIVPFKHFTG